MDERLIAAALAGGEMQCFEYTLPIDGRQFDREARIIACSDEQVLVRDTTERKRAEAMLLRAVAHGGEVRIGLAKLDRNTPAGAAGSGVCGDRGRP